MKSETSRKGKTQIFQPQQQSNRTNHKNAENKTSKSSLFCNGRRKSSAAAMQQLPMG
jgi:hypothetical protein